MAVRLRVFPDSYSDERTEPAIRVRLEDLLPMLAVAKKNNYLWLQDFLDDEIAISADLYEVLRAFGTCLRPSA
jgi:hypothetical protein